MRTGRAMRKPTTFIALSTLFLSAATLMACGESDPDGTGGGGGGGGATTSATTTASTSTSSSSSTTTTETVDPLGPWTVETTTVDGLTPVWGGIVAQESPSVSYLVGGVSGTSGPVTGNLIKVERGPSGVTAKVVSTGLTKRYCGCALVDAGRKELVVLGGRGSAFTETKTAEIVNLETGVVATLEHSGAADHPVGCHAVFLPDRDEGYVFGGAAQAGGFTSEMWRYNPADHTFTLLDGPAGPPARYDGAFRYPVEGGPVWLVGGMGVSGGVKFYSDVWKLDPASGTWSQVAVTGAEPPGRRLPWVTFPADMSAVVMGFGSDSPQGTSMVGDLWRLDLAAGTWSEVPRMGDLDPGKRGFALWLPGPEGSAGLLSGGMEDLGISEQAFVLQPPVTTGDWR